MNVQCSYLIANDGEEVCTFHDIPKFVGLDEIDIQPSVDQPIQPMLFMECGNDEELEEWL